jgi:hypothetical protein
MNVHVSVGGYVHMCKCVATCCCLERTHVMASSSPSSCNAVMRTQGRGGSSWPKLLLEVGHREGTTEGEGGITGLRWDCGDREQFVSIRLRGKGDGATQMPNGRLPLTQFRRGCHETEKVSKDLSSQNESRHIPLVQRRFLLLLSAWIMLPRQVCKGHSSFCILCWGKRRGTNNCGCHLVSHKQEAAGGNLQI